MDGAGEPPPLRSQAGIKCPVILERSSVYEQVTDTGRTQLGHQSIHIGLIFAPVDPGMAKPLRIVTGTPRG